MISFSPRAVLFDFGGTLISNGKSDFLNGFEKLHTAALNPDAATPSQMAAVWREVSDKIKLCKTGDSEGGYGLEVPLSSMLRYIFEKTGLRYDISLSECGIIFDNGNFPARAPTKNMANLLKALKARNIRTAIISNTTMNSEEMSAAANKHLPENEFEFVFTSCDFMFTKPAPDMFELAAKRMELPASDCLYCGDSFINDVTGPLKIGMNALLYNVLAEEAFAEKVHDGKKYTIINDWQELADRI